MPNLPDSIMNTGIVTISPEEPPVPNDGNLWYDPDTPSMSLSHNGVWVELIGAEGFEEVHTGPTAPTSSTKIWVDTSDPAAPATKVLVDGAYMDVITGGRF